MTDILLSSIVSGGGFNRVMPLTAVFTGDIFLKSDDTTAVNASNADFWTALSNDNTARGFDSDVLTTAIGTSETEITNLPSAEGMLTHVITPRAASANTTYTIRVTADGKLSTFIINSKLSNYRALLGDFPVYTAEGTTTVNTSGYGSVGDGGYNTSADIMVRTPLATLMSGVAIGIPFSDSLIVTIQANLAPSANVTERNSAAMYLTIRPQEF